MNTRQKLAKIDKKLAAAAKAADKKWQSQQALYNEQNIVRLEVLKEEGLLKKIKWQASRNGSYIYLQAETGTEDNPELTKFFGGSDFNHESYSLGNEGRVILRFDDGEIRLHFDGLEHARAVIKELELSVSFKDIQIHIANLNEQISDLKAFVKGIVN